MIHEWTCRLLYGNQRWLLIKKYYNEEHLKWTSPFLSLEWDPPALSILLYSVSNTRHSPPYPGVYSIQETMASFKVPAPLSNSLSGAVGPTGQTGRPETGGQWPLTDRFLVQLLGVTEGESFVAIDWLRPINGLIRLMCSRWQTEVTQIGAFYCYRSTYTTFNLTKGEIQSVRLHDTQKSLIIGLVQLWLDY